jgi:FAD/FMN-containing dehydrogenase
MVAADVHGKNHHVEGCFGRHVQWLRLRTGTGAIVTCSRTENRALFLATIGGMGLTGHILEIAVRLVRVASPWIFQESERIPNIDRFLEALKDAAANWPMTAGWIDCLSSGTALGRGILLKGRWAEPSEAPNTFPEIGGAIEVPLTMPHWLLGRATVRAFNAAYYHRHIGRVRRAVVHPKSFFYPLDFLGKWYRLYGQRGFAQYQCVLPNAPANSGVRRLLELVSKAGAASCLGVIKDCGAEGEGLLSFPKPGISIAMDLSMRASTRTLVDRMNELVVAEGGRIYLAKDALSSPEHFRAMEPRLADFLDIRRTWDPQGRVRSAQSVRLFGW